MKPVLSAILIFLFIPAVSGHAAGSLEFTLHKLVSDQPGNTLLVVGGIQGDEPGGFNAAALLTTRYTIHKGSVWIVPNLNFISIIKRARGIYGDLNRKFSRIGSNDPEFKTIGRIKRIIMNDRVDMVLNLHDGSGFFRSEYIDDAHNPSRWGQSIIIDQENIDANRHGRLGKIARKVAADVNQRLYSPAHAYHVKDTKTRAGNSDMLKTLTYYAIRNGKPAFGVEASKTFPTHQRTYYHLRVLEAFMDYLDITFERNFELSGSEVQKAIRSNIKLALYDSKILLDIENARNRLPFIPLKKSSEIDFTSSNPLIAVVGTDEGYRVFHGNRRITRICPEYFEYDWSISAVTMAIDNREKRVRFGEMVYVDKSFLVLPRNGYRVNIIGFKKPNCRDESGIPVHLADIRKGFSVDRKGKIFRVEVYQGPRFSGMILVNFDPAPKSLRAGISREPTPRN